MNPTPLHGQTVTATTPGGVTRTGRLVDFQLRASQTTTVGGEYEALVRWDGDDHNSLVSPDRLAPAATDVARATRCAALTALAFQADPTPEGLATMQDAIDRAIALGATRADIANAR